MSDDVESADCYLGVDGGGTKTHAVVVDARGVERGAALSGPANAHRVGVEYAVAQIVAAAEEAARLAGVRPPFTAAWLGLAGLDAPADFAALAPGLVSLAGIVHLVNDAELLLSALPDQVGIALIAGTGSIAVGRNAAGAATRVGGWGHTLGDEGSGYAIGRSGLVAAARAADGRGEPTSLLDRILAHWGLSAAHELMERTYAGANIGDISLVAQVAPLVLQAARAGDRVAQLIVRRGAVELARAAVVAGDQLGFDAAPLPVALGGSLLLRDPGYRDAVLRAIRRSRPLGEVALVEQPALSAAQASIALASP
jgi:N-acetylglucosamine kinase-like BadF-type ATPase